ncbi:glutamine synthetase [Shewanella sp. 202IG2-18]|uniref:glutamine synthetase family protein n=1 Tax=Parashewanella hymeniacidonis TaxID=2807618 RepID=UPI0019604734|nr:glutamine synthetase family protein [Parashewanella hymeniacidonis]MBM7073832.1 glutamine synthetase [Parashewanella hymeniacidonis]
MLYPREVKTISDAKKIVDARGLSHVKVGFFDMDGNMLGKYMSKKKFFSSLDKGFDFCDVALGWDCKNQLYDNTHFTGWHTGYPDAKMRIIPESCRELPDENGTLLFVCEFTKKAQSICPRSVLQRVIHFATEQGFIVNAGFEYEFFMFQETPESIREKGFKNLKTLSPDWCGYSVLRNSTHSDLYHQILSLAEDMDFPIESLHEEAGPGVIEAAISVDNAESAADKAALFKTFMKVLAQKNELMATFMARWSEDYPGQSGHIHISLNAIKNGHSEFFAPSHEHNMSNIQRHFIAGQQRLMPEFLVLLAPNINSYHRLTPGLWAPTHATWGVDNRTTAIRVIPGDENSQRIEYRLAAADSNPYLALAAALASGLYGIMHKWQATKPVRGNAYDEKHQHEHPLPQTLGQATKMFKQSAAAREMFGDEFVDHFSATREWEEREFRKHISDWELERYFELI